MLPSEYLYFLRDCDFSNLYNKALSDYWAENYEKFSTLLQNYYISSAYYLYKDSAISKDEYELSIDAIFNKKNKILRYYFDVYGYYSSDMFVAMNDNKTMLFIPGATNPFIFADNITDLRDKRKALISDKNTRELFSKHFYLYYRQDGNTYLGVNSMLEQIVSGVVDTNYIMYSNKNIRERNVFESMAFSTRERSFNDGDVIIKSNAEVQRDYALNVLQTILSLSPIFDIVLPEVSIPISLGITASSVGISFDELINGDTYEERRSAIPGLATNAVLLGISFAIPFLISKAAENKLIINNLVGSDENILNKNNLADFLEKYNISESDIPENGSLVINLKNTNVPVRLVKLNDEEGEIVAIKGSTLSGIYYEVDTETGYEILSRRVFRTEYNEKIYWTRGGRTERWSAI